MPVATAALGLGFAAQGMLPRSNAISQSALLDTLMEVPPSSAVDTQAASEQLRQLQAQRGQAVPEVAGSAAPAGQAQALVEPAAAAPVDLEIRVALLGAGEVPSLSANGPWQLVSQQGAVLQQGQAGEPVQLGGLWAAGPEAWLQTCW
jgi:hypothetical protein